MEIASGWGTEKVSRDARAARYYDANPVFPNDIPFYRHRILSPHAKILELGCGTGRVLVSLLGRCGYIHGIDHSEEMLARCRQKLQERAVLPAKARAELGDITNFSLPMQFDLVIAPFRVLQTLETDKEVEGLSRCVRAHLAPGGSCILNAFNPKYDPDGLLRDWISQEETLIWEVPFQGGRLTCHDRRPRMDREKFVLYPELIYRWYQGDALRDVVVLPLVMRCYYPDQLLQLIEAKGFQVTGCWGGYDGEPYGEGPELVVQFTVADRKDVYRD